MKTNKEYLGDGVFIEGDGYGVWLTTDRGAGSHSTDRIYLEPDMVKKLVAYTEGQA